jgi:hypothetical protein
MSFTLLPVSASMPERSISGRVRRLIPVLLALLLAIPALAAIFGTVRVSVRDPQNYSIPNAKVSLRSKTSDWSKMGRTDAEGVMQFDAVPIGVYVVSVQSEGFMGMPQKEIEVNSDKVTTMTAELNMDEVKESVDVVGTANAVNPESSTTQTLTSRSDISLTPGADRTGSLDIITKFVPGSYVMHDHLHSRGGHGVSWQIDGVPVPNSDLATVGSQFDPKDIDYLESQRGGYSAQYGDRSYGVFNVVPRTGFEGERFGDFQLSYGSFNRVNTYLSMGSHTERFAWYASGAGSRTDFGLERPDSQILHDLSASASGFTSLVFNPNGSNQLRLVSSLRHDHYQVPNIPAQQVMGLRDTQNADDAFTNFSWVHTAGPGILWTISPYYHYNRGHYIGGPNDPISPESDRKSNYVGGSMTLNVTKGKHAAKFGTDSFGQNDNVLFGIAAHDGTGLAINEHQTVVAGVAGAYAEDQYKLTHWLTFTGGLRYTHFTGTLSETRVDPRIGTAIQLPKLHWAVRSSYGRYYQHPPLNTISGPLLDFALKQGFGFKPVAGERDEVWEIGLGIPIHGWILDFDRFHNNATNVVDHQVLGNSSLLFPVSIPRGRISGYESTLRSPTIKRHMNFYWSFSNMRAQARGGISGGLTDFKSPATDYFYMDHDQRVTLNSGANFTLPRGIWASTSLVYGSGFLKGDGPDHMPQHATVDLSVGKDIKESWSLRFTALNIMNHQYLTGIDNSFAGTHWANPREFSVQVRHRFHF